MAYLKKILLSQAAVLAYYFALVLIGFHVGQQYLPSYLLQVDASLLGPKLRGCSIHIQNASFLMTEEVTKVRDLEAKNGEIRAIGWHVASVASSVGKHAPPMEDDAFSFDVAV